MQNIEGLIYIQIRAILSPKRKIFNVIPKKYYFFFIKSNDSLK